MEVKTSPRTAHTRANMSIIVSLIWILFALFQSVRTQTARFTSPTTSGTYFINQSCPSDHQFWNLNSVGPNLDDMRRHNQ